MSKKAKIIIAVIAICIIGIVALAANIFSANNATSGEVDKIEEADKIEDVDKIEETDKTDKIDKTEEGTTSTLNINSADDLTTLVDKIYENLTIEMPMLATMPVDITDADAVKAYTGLDSAEIVEYAVVSEPMMSSQAYSMVLVKVKNAIEADAIAREMNEKIDERKWICVTAEKIYTVASGDIICLVMSNEDTAKTVFDKFKTLAGTVGQVYERTAEEAELPEDMLPGQDGLAY